MNDGLSQEVDSDMSHSHENVKLWCKVQAIILCYCKQGGVTTILKNKNMPVAMQT